MQIHSKNNIKNTILPFGKDREIYAEFEDFIIEQDHPCIMAQSVFSQAHVDFHIYENFGSKLAAEKIIANLNHYISNYDFESRELFTFIAGFSEERTFSEKEFEQLLWKQLEHLNEVDEKPWDAAVSKNSENKNFSFSLGGKAFYMVGMHPNSSRKARQAPYPAIVFNMHWQFERLREMGAYTHVRDKIRERDIALQGSINPMVEDFGKHSEARQYSGRKVEKAWKCPFHQANK